MGTLRKVKNALYLNKEYHPLLVRSTLHEVLIDLDGDKAADIALIDMTHDGDIDTIAIDVTGNGDFNVYISDLDGNGIPDAVQFYEDGEDMPLAAYFGKRVEEHMVSLAVHLHNSIVVGEVIAEELIKALEEFEAEAEKAYEQEAGDVKAEASAPAEEENKDE